MTTRNRRPPRTRARTSRRVWVNQNVETALTVNTRQIIDVLQAAPEFMLFDTTILRVILAPLFFTTITTVTQGIREVRYSLFIGTELLDSDDSPTLFNNTIGADHMHVGGSGALFSSTTQLVTFDLTEGIEHIDVKAKRRFRENDSTLWLLVENEGVAGDVGLRMDGYVRTLLHVP